MKISTAFRLLTACAVVTLYGAEGLGTFESNVDIGITPEKGESSLAITVSLK
jgi:hypothetical protein